MKLTLTSLNYKPELTGIGKYNEEMCSYLNNSNFDISVITAPPYYPDWKVHEGYSNNFFNVSYINGVKVTRCPLYVPKEVSTFKRFIHLTTFAISSSLALFCSILKKPDVVVLVQPSLFCAPGVLLFCKLTGVKSVMHIQDYEVDALFGLGMIKKNYFHKLTTFLESWLMRRFDAISTISYSMIDNALLKGVSKEKIIYFPNWADTDFITPMADGSLLKKEWGFKQEDKVILYAGNIGGKQGLDILLEVAQSFKENESIKFVIVGTGAKINELKKLSSEMYLENVFFMPLLPWERVPEMLALADIHLVVQKKGAADIVLPSKLTNILAAGGHAIVTAEKNTELGQLSLKHPGIYTRVEPECSISLKNGIKTLLKKDLSIHNAIAYNYAQQFLSKHKILDRYKKDICNLVN